MTYHTPEPHKEDKFWVAWHIITPVLAILLVIYVILIGRFGFFLIGAISANCVDIWDWLILRPIKNKKKQKNPNTTWGEKYFIHPLIDWIREHVFHWMPNWNYEKKGVIVEIITIGVFWLMISFLLPFLK